MSAYLGGKPTSQLGIQVRQSFLQCGKLCQRVPQRGEISRAGAAECYAGENSLNIADAGKRLLKILIALSFFSLLNFIIRNTLL